MTRQAENGTEMRTIQTACLAAITAAALSGDIASGQGSVPNSQKNSKTAFEHLAVIFQENISFDHYFATYPVAANPPGEPRVEAKPGTPSVNGLTSDLLTKNQNALLPQRLDRSHAATADQNHYYPDEQGAMDHGSMDKFVQFTGTPEADGSPTVVMDYFDGRRFPSSGGFPLDSTIE
jgi:phospholipase C